MSHCSLTHASSTKVRIKVSGYHMITSGSPHATMPWRTHECHINLHRRHYNAQPLDSGIFASARHNSQLPRFALPTHPYNSQRLGSPCGAQLASHARVCCPRPSLLITTKHGRVGNTTMHPHCRGPQGRPMRRTWSQPRAARRTAPHKLDHACATKHHVPTPRVVPMVADT